RRARSSSPGQTRSPANGSWKAAISRTAARFLRRAPEDLETSLSQTRDWPEGGAVLSNCKAMIVVSDLLANWHDHRVLLAVFQKVVRTLLEMTPCAAVHWVPSLRVVNPEAFLRSQQPGPSHCPTYGAVNVRLFQVEGGAPGEFCMDTMGLATLGLPDVQF